jgi:hypothetical protein
MRYFALIAVCALSALAADVTGKWTATPPAGKKAGKAAREIVLNLKAEGEKLTGTITTGRRPVEISEGKITGDEISFVVASGGKKQQKAARLQYRGKVSGNEIRFTRTREGGRRGQEFTAKKAS